MALSARRQDGYDFLADILDDAGLSLTISMDEFYRVADLHFRGSANHPYAGRHSRGRTGPAASFTRKYVSDNF